MFQSLTKNYQKQSERLCNAYGCLQYCVWFCYQLCIV